MISFRNNSVALRNLHVTVEALERIDSLLELYNDKDHSVNVAFTKPGGTVQVQLNAEIAREALRAQRLTLVTYLRNLGIDYDA